MSASPSSPSKKRGQQASAPANPPPIAPAPVLPNAQAIAPATTTSLMATAAPVAPMPINTEAANIASPSTAQSQPASPTTTRKRKAAEMSAASQAGPSIAKSEPGTEAGTDSLANQVNEAAVGAQPASVQPTPAKRSRTNTPWTAAEERKLKTLRDAGSSWGEIAKEFPNRTEGSVKKHWYKDMHYADFAEDESAALLAAIREYEASKWKEIGKKVGKPAKACEQYAKENFQGKL